MCGLSFPMYSLDTSSRHDGRFQLKTRRRWEQVSAAPRASTEQEGRVATDCTTSENPQPLKYIMVAALVTLASLWFAPQASAQSASNPATRSNTTCGPRPWRDVMCYGAKGDSVTDDGPAIQRALNDSCANGPGGGGSIVFPPPPINYFIHTPIKVDTKLCDEVHFEGGQGPRTGGMSQFGRAPRISIQGDALPIFQIDNCWNPGASPPCTKGADIKVTFEDLNIMSSAGKGIRTVGVPFLLLKNVGVSYNYNPAVPHSAALSMEDSTLWFKAEDSDFATQNHNKGPFNPAQGKDYDPTSWAPPAMLVVGNSNHDGSILFNFDNVTWAHGGVKFTAEDNVSGSCGLTYGEVIFNMNVIEGQFASPLLQWANLRTGANCSATLERVTMIESQAADVAHHTPLVSAEGIDGAHTASIGSIFFLHSLSHSTCYVQGINGHENIAGIWSDSPHNVAYACNANSVPAIGSSLIHHTNGGLDFIAPAGGPARSAITDADGGSIRTFIPDGKNSDTLAATSMIDSDGRRYLGAGGTEGFDLSEGRHGANTWDVSVPVEAPATVAAKVSAGGTFPDGTYYVRVAAGDRNSAPFTTSAASSETKVTLGQGNHSIALTWNTVAMNPGQKYTIYLGTAPAMENKAISCTCAGGATLTAMPGSNQIPSRVGNLLTPEFEVGGRDMRWDTGVGYFGILSHANSANRTYTFPDASISVPGTVTQTCGTSSGGSPAACTPTNISASSKLVVGTVTMNGMAPSTAAITNMPAFSSATSYACTVTSQTAATDTFKVTNISATSLTITGPNSSHSVASYICVGN